MKNIPVRYACKQFTLEHKRDAKLAISTAEGKLRELRSFIDTIPTKE